MSRVLRTYVEPVVEHVTYTMIVGRIASCAGVTDVVNWLDLDPKQVLLHAAKAHLSVRLKGDVMSFRPDADRPFEFYEAKVPANKRAPVRKPASRKPAKPIRKWLSDEWKRHDARTQ